VVEWRWS
jgi:hypothetical protein